MANSPSGDALISRIIRILETFSEDRITQTASEIGCAARLPSSTAHRITKELVDAGVLERDDDRRLRLGMRLWELALRGSTALRLRHAALPHMERVRATLRQHTQLAVLENEEALFIERLSHVDAGANLARIAGRLPLHATSSGLVLLAYADPALRERILASPLKKIGPLSTTDPRVLRRILTQVRSRGVAVARQTIESASQGLAVPVGDGGVVVAALSVVLPDESRIEPAEATLREAAAGIERNLRAAGPGR